MTRDSEQDVVEAIRGLYHDKEWARRLFENLANRKRNLPVTTIEHLTRILGVSVTEATVYAKVLHDAGCGAYIVGRKGKESRFEWYYNAVSLGAVAIGRQNEIEGSDDGEEDDGEGAADAQPALTIAQAKEALARTLGIRPDQIEIIIKA